LYTFVYKCIFLYTKYTFVLILVHLCSVSSLTFIKGKSNIVEYFVNFLLLRKIFGRRFEKLVSGLYLGEIVRRVMLNAIHRNLIFSGVVSKPLQMEHRFMTKYLSEIEMSVGRSSWFFLDFKLSLFYGDSSICDVWFGWELVQLIIQKRG